MGSSAHSADPPWANAPFKYPLDRTVEIDPSALGDCLAAVTFTDFQRPTLDRKKMNDPYDSSDFFTAYLPAAPHRLHEYATGKEDELKKWVLEQKDNSIDPVRVYRKSLTLNGGNVWNAILTIHQLLRLNARWWQKKAYFYASSDAEETVFFNKFIDLRGDLRERGKNKFNGQPFTGDHPGTWYRIWGMMLYRLQMEDEGTWERSAFPAKTESGICQLSQSISLWSSDLGVVSIATASEWIKPFIGESEDDWRKDEINRNGGRAASQMVKRLQQGNLPENLDRCENPQQYLKELYY